MYSWYQFVRNVERGKTPGDCFFRHIPFQFDGSLGYSLALMAMPTTMSVCMVQYGGTFSYTETLINY